MKSWQIAWELACRVAEALPNKRIVVAVDGLYAAKDFFGNLPENVAAVSRPRKDAASRSVIVPPSRGWRSNKALEGHLFKALPLPGPCRLAAAAQRRQDGSLPYRAHLHSKRE